jgi:hypothetical protein
LDFYDRVVGMFEERTESFLLWFMVEAMFVALFKGIAVLVIGAFTILTLLDLIRDLRSMESARKLKTFFLALLGFLFSVFLIQLLGA